MCKKSDGSNDKKEAAIAAYFETEFWVRGISEENDEFRKDQCLKRVSNSKAIEARRPNAMKIDSCFANPAICDTKYPKPPILDLASGFK